MGCCGSKRAALTAANNTSGRGRAPRPTAARAVAAPAGPTALVRYIGSDPLVVHGASSATAYGFSGMQPVQAVRTEDVPALLGMGLFARAS